MIKQKIFSTAIIVLEAVLLIGVFTFLAPCPIKEHIMGCHWVANVSAGISSVVIFLSLAAVIAGSALTRKGLNLAVLSISVLHALVPQVLISICAGPSGSPQGAGICSMMVSNKGVMSVPFSLGSSDA